MAIKAECQATRLVTETKQPYKFQLLYKPGKSNPAHSLSRHVSDIVQKSSREQRLAESIINYVSSTSAPKPGPIDVIRQHTSQDATLNQTLIQKYLTDVTCLRMSYQPVQIMTCY